MTMKNVGRKVKSFAEDHKGEIALGGIFVAGGYIGYKLGVSHESSFKRTMKNVLRWLDKGGISTSTREGVVCELFMKNSKRGEGLAIALDEEDTRNYIKAMAQALKEVK